MTGYFSAAPRPLNPGDAESARALVRGALGLTRYRDRVLELLVEAERADGDTQALVVERDGTIAALALFGRVAGAVNVWIIRTILIAPRVDLREMGRAMVDGVIETIRLRGGRLLVAELPDDTAYGQTFSLLRANGFDQEGRIPDYFRDGVALLFLRRAL